MDTKARRLTVKMSSRNGSDELPLNDRMSSRSMVGMSSRSSAGRGRPVNHFTPSRVPYLRKSVIICGCWTCLNLGKGVMEIWSIGVTKVRGAARKVSQDLTGHKFGFREPNAPLFPLLHHSDPRASPQAMLI
jgi:hypothetical protein